MELSSILYTLIIFLTATAVCVILFNRLGFGSVVGFIVAGVIVGPHPPGPVTFAQVDELQNISELGVVLFLFTVGLEMRPKQLWAMRRQLFGLGGAQVLLSAAAFGGFLIVPLNLHWQSAVIVGLGLAQSSTAVVMTILGERGELATQSGQSSFAILMAQDMSIVPVMALIPILSHGLGHKAEHPLWMKTLMIAGVLTFIFVGGRYILPKILGYAARHRSKGAFGVVLFLGVIAAAWAVDQVGISMTLGSFLLGTLLSASDYRYQVESVIEPFKGTLMGLFFIAIGMSIDVHTLIHQWEEVLLLVAAVLAIKIIVLTALCRAFGIDRQACVRTAFYLSQVGEFAFVLFAASVAAGLLSQRGAILGFLVISISMITTPIMVKLSDRIARRLRETPETAPSLPAKDMSHHLVIVGLDEVGFTIALMAEKSGVPYIAFDRDYSVVRQGKQAGRIVYFGDILSDVVQQGAGLTRARAVFVSTTDTNRLRAIVLSLRQLFPNLNIFARVRTLKEQEFLRSRGIKHAGTMFIESTLFRGEELLKDLGVTEVQAKQLIDSMRKNDYALIRAAFSQGDIESSQV